MIKRSVVECNELVIVPSSVETRVGPLAGRQKAECLRNEGDTSGTPTFLYYEGKVVGHDSLTPQSPMISVVSNSVMTLEGRGCGKVRIVLMAGDDGDDETGRSGGPDDPENVAVEDTKQLELPKKFFPLLR